MARTKLTIKDVLRNPTYTNILFLIQFCYEEAKPVQFMHLRYALCKNHGLKLNDYIKERLENHFKITRAKDITKVVEENYKKGNYTKYQFSELKKKYEETILDMLKNDDKNFKDNKFNTYQSLGNALSRLKKIGIVTNKKIGKSGYSTYYLTPTGVYYETLRMIQSIIDKAFPTDIKFPEEMEKLNEYDKEMIMDARRFRNDLYLKTSELHIARFKKEFNETK